MAHEDWKRYYMVVYDKPYELKGAKIFRDRYKCYRWLKYIRENPAVCCGRKPLGIVGVRGRRHRPDVQIRLSNRAH